MPPQLLQPLCSQTSEEMEWAISLSLGQMG
jgi:hypothetical protein